MADGKKAIDPFEHVVDAKELHFFDSIHFGLHGLEVGGIPLKFMLLMAICAASVAIALIWLGRKMSSGEPPRGKLWNLIEYLVFFVRDRIVKPGVGEHDTNRYLPYLTTLFLFIFAMNLIGMLPFLGSPTASIMVTGALALISFVVIHAAGIEGNHGFKGYLKTFIPPIHIEGGAGMQLMGKVITVGIAALEYATAFIRCIVLAVRLFANMLAGHTVLFMILLFIALVTTGSPQQIKFAEGKDWMYYLVMPFSVTLVTALSLLELFIAGLQAFIFTFLTAVFIGLAKHPAH
jgi:F-type H+-transporting ATPase subunit a